VDTDELTMTVATRGRVCRVDLIGDVTAASGKRLAHTVLAALHDGARTVELDLTGVKFIDSSGIEALIRCRAVAAEDADCGVRIVAMSKLVRRVLEVTGLDGVLADDSPS
jgi:anti-sigma B factor antagonist